MERERSRSRSPSPKFRRVDKSKSHRRREDNELDLPKTHTKVNSATAQLSPSPERNILAVRKSPLMTSSRWRSKSPSPQFERASVEKPNRKRLEDNFPLTEAKFQYKVLRALMEIRCLEEHMSQ